jgi:hypothetical protein
MLGSKGGVAKLCLRSAPPSSVLKAAASKRVSMKAGSLGICFPTLGFRADSFEMEKVDG